MFDQIVNSNTENDIDYSDTKAEFIISKADTIIKDENGVKIGKKHYKGKEILAVTRRSDIGFTVVLTEEELQRFKKQLL